MSSSRSSHCHLPYSTTVCDSRISNITPHNHNSTNCNMSSSKKLYVHRSWHVCTPFMYGNHFVGTTPNLLVFRLGYVQYPNNTIVLLEDIGEGVNALFCVSNNTSCCLGSSPFRGKFYYPNNTEVPISSGQHSAYRDRESGSVRLNQRASATQPPLGRYRCEILDDKGDIQWLFINIGKNITNATALTVI